MNKELLTLIQNTIAAQRNALARYYDTYGNLPIAEPDKVTAIGKLVTALIEVESGIDKINRNGPNRTPQEAAIMLRLAKQGVHPSDIDRRTAEEIAAQTKAHIELIFGKGKF